MPRLRDSPTLYEGCSNDDGSKSYFSDSGSGYPNPSKACDNATPNCNDAPSGSKLTRCPGSVQPLPPLPPLPPPQPNGDSNSCGDSNSWTADIKQCFINTIKTPDMTNDQAVCIVNNISQKYSPHMFNSLSQSQDSNLLAFLVDVMSKCVSDSTYNGNYDQSCNSDSDCDSSKSCKSGVCKKTSGLSTMAIVGIVLAILVFLIICVFLVKHFSHSATSSFG